MNTVIQATFSGCTSIFQTRIGTVPVFQGVAHAFWSGLFCWYHHSVTLGWLHGGGSGIWRESCLGGEWRHSKLLNSVLLTQNFFERSRFPEFNTVEPVLSGQSRKLKITFFNNFDLHIKVVAVTLY